MVEKHSKVETRLLMIHFEGDHQGIDLKPTS